MILNMDQFYMSWILHDHFDNNFLHIVRAHRHHFPRRRSFVFSQPAADQVLGPSRGFSIVAIDETQTMGRDTSSRDMGQN